MSTKVKIKNFQSIGSTEFTIDGFTVIVGKNNIGKSAVVRSIDAALTNRAGKEFIRHGQKSTEVSIKRDGLDISWKKGSKTTCTVNGETYSALNRSVPQALIDAGFRKMEFGTEKLNPLLASQFDPLFLLNKTGSVITEALSALYRLDVISSADDLCQKQLRATKSMHKTRAADLVDLEEKLKKFEGFDEIKESFQKARKIQQDCDDLEREITVIEGYESQLSSLTENVRKLKRVKGIEIPEAFSLESDIEDLQQVTQWSVSLKECAGLVRALKNAVDILKGVDGVSVGNLESIISDLKDIAGYEQSFTESVSQARASKNEIADIEKALESIEKEFSEFKVCPLCERPL